MSSFTFSTLHTYRLASHVPRFFGQISTIRLGPLVTSALADWFAKHRQNYPQNETIACHRLPNSSTICPTALARGVVKVGKRH